jgi:hypothetical protein
MIKERGEGNVDVDDEREMMTEEEGRGKGGRVEKGSRKEKQKKGEEGEEERRKK